jgi:hypothetical protein
VPIDIARMRVVMAEHSSDVQKQWLDFRTEAVNAVRVGHLSGNPQDRFASGILSLLYEPSFDPVVGWTLYKRRQEQEQEPVSYFVSRTTWRQTEDVRLFTNPLEHVKMQRLKHLQRFSPAMEFGQADIEESSIRPILDQLSGLRLPVMVGKTLSGTDGFNYELTVSGAWARCVFRWWVDCPEEWRPIGDVTERLIELFDEALTNVPD